MSNHVEIDAAEHQFESFVSEAEQILAPTQWEIGRIASECKEVTGKTDAELGERIGLSRDQVQQRRSVWDRFGDDSDTYRNLKWSHFHAAMNWDDATQTLAIADRDMLTVRDMVRYHDLRHGKTTPTITAVVPVKGAGIKPLVQPKVSPASEEDEEDDIWPESAPAIVQEPWGEKEAEPDPQPLNAADWRTARSKAKKTVEALMRALCDLNGAKSVLLLDSHLDDCRAIILELDAMK